MRNNGAASAELSGPFLPELEEAVATGSQREAGSRTAGPALVHGQLRAAPHPAVRSISAAQAVIPIDLEHLPTATAHYRVTKRLVDILLSLLMLPVIGAVLVVLAIVVAVTSGFPIFYRQQRLGQHGTTFQIFKFRTMHNRAGQVLDQWLAAHPEAQREWQETHKLKDDPRITPVGRFLRETSLDELPQIINVLLGDMSLVGPRPIVQAERIRYQERFRFYSAARPGVTGVWQISGRSKVTYDQRVLMDEGYVRHWTLMRDLWILLRTPRSVFGRDGAY